MAGEKLASLSLEEAETVISLLWGNDCRERGRFVEAECRKGMIHAVIFGPEASTIPHPLCGMHAKEAGKPAVPKYSCPTYDSMVDCRT